MHKETPMIRYEFIHQKMYLNTIISAKNTQLF